MISARIEEKAVGAIRDSILATEYLFPHINSNDREPSWDGYINIYSSKAQTSDSLEGRVHVQVKGMESKEALSSILSYDVRVSDLKNYLRDGGSIYFVVALTPLYTKIFYQAFTPVRLITLLKECENQKTKRIEFKEFPTSENLIRQIMVNLYQDSKKQHSFNETSMISAADLHNIKDITQISASITGYGVKSDHIQMFLENDVYLYAQRKGIEISIPVLLDPHDMIIKEAIECEISVCGTKFYDSVVLTNTKETRRATIGDSISFDITELDKPGKLTFSPSRWLKKRICDLEFFVNVLKYKEFNLGDDNFKLNKIEANSATIKAYEDNLKHLRDILHVLEVLHVKKDMDLSSVTKEDERRINYLISAFVKNQEVGNLKVDLPIRGYLKVCNLNLLLVFSKSKKQRGKYKIYDYFNSNLVFAFDVPDSDEKIPATLYSTLTSDEFINVDNIDYENMIEIFEDIKRNANPNIAETANRIVLNLLLAYDKSKNPEHLIAAEHLNNWEIHNSEQLNSKIATINTLQIIKRKRGLYSQELSELCSLVEDPSSDAAIKFCAYLLMDNKVAADIHYQKLSTEYQNELAEEPIFHFYET